MRESLSSDHYSTDTQAADVLSWLSNHEDKELRDLSDRFVTEFPEYNGLVWGMSNVDTEASMVDPEYMQWVVDWIEQNTPVMWDDGEPWADDGGNPFSDHDNVPDTWGYLLFAIMDDFGTLCEECVIDPDNPVHDERENVHGGVVDGWGVVAFDHIGNTDGAVICDNCNKVVQEEWET